MDGPSPSIGTTLTSGIQDISALLPLLGTEQCEEHVGSALSDGYLYAAMSPISIFGSLGIARTGFKALLASISIPRWRFIGAQKLRDGGFKPSGKNLSLIMMDPGCVERHLAETRLDSLLKTSQLEGLQVEDLSRLTITTTCFQWNMRMLLLTAISCIVGIAPYIHLNVDRGGNRLEPFTRWAFPIARLLGGFLSTTSLQFLIQRRLLAIVKNRLIFHALNNGEDASIVLSQGTPRTSLLWDLQKSSELCLWRLEWLVRRNVVRRESLARATKIIRKFHELLLHFYTQLKPNNGEPRGHDRQLGQPSTDGEGSAESIRPSNDIESGIPQDLGQIALAKLGEALYEAKRLVFPAFDPWGLIVRVSMALGIAASVVGYVGCFSVVQGARRSIAPILWLLLEGILSVIRMMIWSWNPESDDSDPIKISLELGSHPPLSTCCTPLNKILDDKVLPLVRAPEFLRSIKSYTGFLEPFNMTDMSLFHTLTRKSIEAPGVHERVLLITMVDHKERTATVYYEADGNEARFFAASPLIVDLASDILQAEIKTLIDPARLGIMESPGQRSALEAHYRSILGQLRRRDSDPDASEVDEIRMNWTLNKAYPTRTTSQKDQPKGPREKHREHEVPDDEMTYFQQSVYQVMRQQRSAHQHRWLDSLMAEVEIQIRRELESLPSEAPAETFVMYQDALALERFALESLFLHEIRAWENYLWNGQMRILNQVVQRRGKSSSTDPLVGRLRRDWARTARARLGNDQAHTYARIFRAKKAWIQVAASAGVSREDRVKLRKSWNTLQASLEAEWRNLIRDCVNETSSGRDLNPKAPPLTASGQLGLSLERFTTEGKERFRRCTLLYNYWKDERERRLNVEARDVQGWIDRGLPNWDASRGRVHSGFQHSIIPQMFVSPPKWIRITPRTVKAEGLQPLSHAIHRNPYIYIVQFADFYTDEDLANAISAIIPRSTTASSITTITILDCFLETGDHTVSTLATIIKENPGIQSIFTNVPLVDVLAAHAVLVSRQPDIGPQASSSFTFHGFEVEHHHHDTPLSRRFISTKNSHASGSGSKIQVRFMGQRDDKVKLRLHHDSFGYRSSGSTLSLHLSYGTSGPYSIASTEVMGTSIWFSPDIDVASGVVNVITITPPNNVYTLYAIDLVDQDGKPYGYSAPGLFHPAELFGQPSQEPPEPSPEPPAPPAPQRAHKPAWRRVKAPRRPSEPPAPATELSPAVRPARRHLPLSGQDRNGNALPQPLSTTPPQRSMDSVYEAPPVPRRVWNPPYDYDDRESEHSSTPPPSDVLKLLQEGAHELFISRKPEPGQTPRQLLLPSPAVLNPDPLTRHNSDEDSDGSSELPRPQSLADLLHRKLETQISGDAGTSDHGKRPGRSPFPGQEARATDSPSQELARSARASWPRAIGQSTLESAARTPASVPVRADRKSPELFGPRLPASSIRRERERPSTPPPPPLAGPLQEQALELFVPRIRAYALPADSQEKLQYYN